MRRLVLALARQTALQTRHDRLPWAIPAYFVACLVLVPFASHLALGSGSRAALETGLLLQWWVVCAAGGWLGLRGVGLELERRTATVVLSGPVDPGTWLAGRALGAAGALAALIAGLQAAWIPVALWLGLSPGLELVPWSAALWLEGAVVAALTALLSTRTRPLVAAGAAAGLWIAGHLAGEYTRLASESGAGAVSTAIFTVIPDLDLLDLQTPIVTGAPLDPTHLAVVAAYGVCWLVALGGLTVASLRSRDLS